MEAEDVISYSLLQWKHEAVCFGEHLRWAQWEGFTFKSIQAFWLKLKNILLFSYKRWKSRPKLNIGLHRPAYKAQIASFQFRQRWMKGIIELNECIAAIKCVQNEALEKRKPVNCTVLYNSVYNIWDFNNFNPGSHVMLTFGRRDVYLRIWRAKCYYGLSASCLWSWTARHINSESWRHLFKNLRLIKIN